MTEDLGLLALRRAARVWPPLERLLDQPVPDVLAVTEDELWTHPLYDLCKISHSALGDYDFINNGLYEVGFTDHNDLVLRFRHANHAALKPLFREAVAKAGYNEPIMRLGEASLFLSMLPLHIDYPNKVVAFLLKANQILDEVESE